MLINLRNALVVGKRLPYDAEVEYLESTGTQWIDTGISPVDGMEVSLRFSLTALVSGTGAFVFGSEITWSNNAVGLVIRNTGNHAIEYGSVKILKAAPPVVDSDLDVRITKTGATYGSYSISYSGEIQGNDYPIYIFCSDRAGTVNQLGLKFKLYKFQIEKAGTLCCDLIPVRKGTVGYLYDRVSRKLFGNAGTGDFVLGPDVVPVEYIESFRGSGGGQYINTGILATTATKWEIDLAFTTTTSGQLMGCGYSGIQRFNIGIESNAFRGGFGGGWFTISNTRDTNRHLWRLESLSAAQCEASIDGGAAVSYTSTFSPYSGPILLGRRYASESVTGARYYGNKIWISGDLVQNLLPVRVGTDATSWEGSMMDVLTRRIYRNAGTGAFTYGNDLKYPIPAE